MSDPEMTRRAAMGLLGLGMLGASGSGASADEAASLPPAGTELHTRAIPSSGERLPVIGLGTWQTFDVGTEESERAPLEEVLQALLAGGGRLIDASPMYGRSEQVAGDLLAQQELGSRAFVATKVWTRGRQEGIRQMEDSMRKLRSRPVDLMQVHNLVDVGVHLDTLRAWKREGRVRYLGITHYHVSGYDAVEALLRSESLDFLQINYSIAERDAEKRLLPLARDKGVAVIVNRPFAGGQGLARLLPKPLPEWAGELGCESWAQLLLKFVLSHPAVTAAIPATSKRKHLLDNLRAGCGRLPNERERQRIAEASR